jgi:hypothetical protein
LYPAANGNGHLNRSASSVTSRPKSKAPIAKPVRRSKSQLVQQQPRNYVTSIQGSILQNVISAENFSETVLSSIFGQISTLKQPI